MKPVEFATHYKRNDSVECEEWSVELRYKSLRDLIDINRKRHVRPNNQHFDCSRPAPAAYFNSTLRSPHSTLFNSTLTVILFAPSKASGHKKPQVFRLGASGTSMGTRTPVFAVRGRRLNRLTMEACLAAELGFEPRLNESESFVLPLHNSAPFLERLPHPVNE